MADAEFDPTGDSYLDSSVPTTNFGADDFIRAGYEFGPVQRPVIRFNVSSLDGYPIITASLKVSVTESGYVAGTYKVYRLSQTGWVEADVTWNKYNSTTDWATAGASHVPNDHVTSSPTPVQFAGTTGTGWLTISGLAAFVQDAIDNRSGALELLIISDDEAGDGQYLKFYSSDYSVETPWPQLDVKYTDLRDVAGVQPAATGALTVIRYKRSVAGVQPAPYAWCVPYYDIYAAGHVTDDGEYFTYFENGIPTGEYGYWNAMNWHDIGRQAGDGGFRSETNYRFDNVVGPTALERVVDAYIEFTTYASFTTTGQHYIKGEDADDPIAIPHNDDQEWRDRLRTTASVNWTAPGPKSYPDKFKIPNIASVLQEIFDRPGWENGNAVNIFILNDINVDPNDTVKVFAAAANADTLYEIRPKLLVLFGPARTVAGAQPSATGALTATLQISRSTAGVQPACTGTLARFAQCKRSLAGTQLAPTGTLARLASTFRAVAGDEPAATSTLTRSHHQARAPPGVQPAATGVLTCVYQALRSVSGTQPAAAGTLSRVEQANRSLVGVQPPAAGVLSRIEQAVRAVVGTQPYATGTLAAEKVSLSAPTSFDAFNPTQNTIDLSWVQGVGSTHTLIRRKVGSYPTNRTDGVEAYFSTGESHQDTSLDPDTAYYYRAWGAKLES